MDHIINIYGLPKKWSYYKLTRLIRQQINGNEADWELQNLIPLEKTIMATVACRTKDDCGKFLSLSHLRKPPHSIPITAQLALPDDESPADNLLNLHPYCLREIIEMCPLKTQIVLAKTCQRLHVVVVDIWRQRFEQLHFSYEKFNTELELSNEEIYDFCLSIGPHVKTLTFNSYYTYDMVFKMRRDSGRLMESCKYFVNTEMCRHLANFPHLQCVSMISSNVIDFTVRALARFCPQVRKLELLNGGTELLKGKYFHLFPQLQLLNLNHCDGLEERYMRKVWRYLRELRELNIIGCKLYQNSEHLRHLCEHATQLQTLRLSPITDERALESIFSLPHLRNVRFSYYRDHQEFEQMLFAQLRQHCGAKLQMLRFVCDFTPTEEASRAFLETMFGFFTQSQKFCREQERASWRISVEMLLSLLQQLPQLTTLTFEYCRPVTVNDLCVLAERCNQLKWIKLKGCHQENDYEMLQLFQERYNQNCQLDIDGQTNWIDVKCAEKRRREMPRSLRGIECVFNWQ